MTRDTEAEINIRVLWCAAQYLRDEHGEDVLAEVAASAALDEALIDDTSSWIRVAQVSTFFEGVRSKCASDEMFRQACIHRMAEAYGPLRFVLPATTPRQVIKWAAKTIKLVSSVSEWEIVEDKRNHLRMLYRSTVPEHESRLVCISRQAQSAAVVTLFGLPPAIVRETSCIALGDDCCDYDYRFYTRSRWMPPVLGGATGLAAAWAMVEAALALPATWVVMPTLFACLGLIYELRRTYQGNLAHGEAIQGALREIAEDEAEARREILDLHGRQNRWAELMEEQFAERTRASAHLVDRLRQVEEQRATDVRGVSHDLRNPLAVLRANCGYLRRSIGGGEDIREAIDDADHAIETMEVLLRDLVETARSSTRMLRMTPTELEVEPWVGILRRRLRALVFGRDVRVSVFRTREAPEVIETDLLVFERVIDNLCTNAAKFTTRGSIVMELDGTPGLLTIKISDTGCGIDEARIAEIFHPRRPREAPSVPYSLGVGLSVVVNLMHQIGGRLEVMSKVGDGTTFWAHFPVSLEEGDARVPAESTERLTDSVVTIRKAHHR